MHFAHASAAYGNFAIHCSASVNALNNVQLPAKALILFHFMAKIGQVIGDNIEN